MADQEANVKEFIALAKKIEEHKERGKKLESRKTELKTKIAKQFGESGTIRVTVDGMTVHLQKYVSAAANEGLRPELIKAMAKHKSTKDYIKPNLHGGSFNAYVSGFDESGMMTAEELHDLLPEWMQPLVHVNSSTIALAKPAPKS